jgi:predicted aldo/keto reductase-like oxidoreductase
VPEEIKAVFSKVDSSRNPSEWALKWVLNSPEVSIALSGMNAMTQVDENIKSASETLPGSFSKTEFDAIAEAREKFKVRIKTPCTGCEYCMPCPNGVNIPASFALYNDYHMFDPGNAKRAYFFRLKPEQRASACIGCGECETHCPQSIHIRDELKNVENIFEK